MLTDQLQLHISNHASENQPISSSQLLMPESTHLPPESQPSPEYFILLHFASQSLSKISNLFCSEVLCLTCTVLPWLPRKNSAFFLLILNVYIFSHSTVIIITLNYILTISTWVIETVLSLVHLALSFSLGSILQTSNNSPCEASITLMPKPGRHFTRK